MMPYYAVSVTLFMAYGDSNLLGRLQPHGARVIWIFFPRGQPCLVCWLVSPPKWREAPSLLRSPFLVPLWVVSALALWDVTPLGGVAK